MTRRLLALCTRFVPPTRLLPALLLGAAALPGCFLGRPYQDFRAYYNTFYNAEQAYEDGLEQIEQEDEPIDRDQYLAVFSASERGRGSNVAGFKEAVDKSADMLRERPDTRYADDALMLIGKSYFYQENVVGAEQKFREAVEVALEREDEGQADEARFWLGRTLAAAERFDDAADVLRLAVERDGISREWEAQMQLALGDLFVRAGDYDQAADALASGLERVRKGDVAARAQFLLGQVYETLGDYDRAASSYAEVQRYKPLYELGYAAQLSEALVLGLHAGQPDAALARLRRMGRDDKNFDNYAEVEVARARVLLAAGRPEDARDAITDRLYDKVRPASGPAATEGYYRLAEVYRDGFRDYVGASTYLDTAATSFRPLPRDVRLTPGAIRDVDRDARAFATFADAARRVAEFDSLLYLGSLDDEAYAAAIERIRQDRIAQRRQEEAEQRRLETQGEFGRSAAGAGLNRRPTGAGTGRDDEEIDDTIEGEPFGGDPVASSAADGFLGYRNAARVQQSLVNFRIVWGNRPLAPNWRRAEAVGDLGGSAASAGAGTVGRDADRDAFDIVVDDAGVPRDEAARTEMRLRRAGARYELGNRLFLQLGRPDSAAVWFETVLREDADSDAALRARYALAEVRREQGRDADAEALYGRLLSEVDPASSLARQVRQRLGLRDESASADTSALASTAYAEARRVWRDGRYGEALGSLFDVEAAFPQTDAAPRALLAAGLAYTEWAQQDTLDAVGLFDPLPVRRRSAPDSIVFDLDALYDGLQADYGDTPYAERAGMLQAALGPLRPLPPPDSLAADSTLADSTAAPSDLLAAGSEIPADSLGAAQDLVQGSEMEDEEDLDLVGDVFEEQADQAVDAALTAMPTPEEAGPPGDQITDDEPEVVADRFDQEDLIGDEPLDASLGGFTWQVMVSQDLALVEQFREVYRRQRFRTALYPVNLEDGAGFGLLVGQFPTAPEARAARHLFVRGSGEDLALLGIGDLLLLNEDEGEDGAD